jgi:hypothetical protein
VSDPKLIWVACGPLDASEVVCFAHTAGPHPLPTQGAVLLQKAASQALRPAAGESRSWGVLVVGSMGPKLAASMARTLLARSVPTTCDSCPLPPPPNNHTPLTPPPLPYPTPTMQVLAALPFELRSKILRHLYAGIIARVPLLQAMVGDDIFLTDVCVRLQHYTSSRDSFVYQRGAVAAAKPPRRVGRMHETRCVCKRSELSCLSGSGRMLSIRPNHYPLTVAALK